MANQTLQWLALLVPMEHTLYLTYLILVETSDLNENKLALAIVFRSDLKGRVLTLKQLGVQEAGQSSELADLRAFLLIQSWC